MREILFRGKRKKNGEWICGDYIAIYDDPKYKAIKTFIELNTGIYEVEPDTVGQYTGFLDKNGIKIFENDVIFAYEGEAYGGCYENSIQVIVKYDYDTLEMLGNVPNYEIIGNIFDNPELIGGVEK